MPELPEVETIRRNLLPLLINKRIRKIIVRDDRLVKYVSVYRLSERLKDKNIVSLLRRGKYLIFKLSSGEFIVIHLKMTGQLIHNQQEDKKSCLSFYFSDGNYLNFNDQRRFGEITLINKLSQHQGLIKLGPEPLEKLFTLKKFKVMIKAKNTRLKPLLLNQQFIAGLGNIYASEVLYLAKINPARIA